MVEFTDQLDEKNHRPEECYIKDDFSLGDFLLKERSKCQFLAFFKDYFLRISFLNFSSDHLHLFLFVKNKIAKLRLRITN